MYSESDALCEHPYVLIYTRAADGIDVGASLRLCFCSAFSLRCNTSSAVGGVEVEVEGGWESSGSVVRSSISITEDDIPNNQQQQQPTPKEDEERSLTV